MNILLLCGNLSYAGAQRQLFELAKGLNKKHDVIVCSISSNVSLLQNFEENNIRVEVLGLRKRYFISILYKLYNLIKNNEIQVIYGFLSTANTYSRIIKLFFPSIKIISSKRNSDSKETILNKLFEKMFSKMTDLYIANSFAGQLDLKYFFNIKNSVVVLNGVDTGRFQNISNYSCLKKDFPNYIIISMVARIKKQKNYEMFLKVAEKVCTSYDNVVFFSIGDDPIPKDAYKSFILKENSKLKMKDRILFIGARSDIPEILSETDISILTSHREGCSNTVLESMFSKRPLVVTDVGDNKRMLAKMNQDFIIKPNDVQMMVNKISYLIDNPDLRKKIGMENYRKAQKEFTQEKMVKNTESVIMSLLNN